MMERQKRQPKGLSATSTHDTKRGEDARALLYTLSEAPVDWTIAFARWRSLNARYLTDLSGKTVPEPDVEWMLYQALAGIWPDSDRADDITRRFTAYAEKAVREAKLTTSWTDVDEAYEDAVKTYAEALTSAENSAFRQDLVATIGPFVAAGAVNSLSQTLIKLTAPGIPDIYQEARRPTSALSILITGARPTLNGWPGRSTRTVAKIAATNFNVESST